MNTPSPGSCHNSYVRQIPMGLLFAFLSGSIRFAGRNWRSLSELKRIKAAARHPGASYIGHLAARFLLPSAGRARDGEMRRLSARIFGSWAVSVLAMDALVDELELSEEAVDEFFHRWQGLLADPPADPVAFPSDGSRAGRFASLSLSSLQDTLFLARDIRSKVDPVHRKALENGYRHFVDQGAVLAEAERQSLHQKKTDARNDLKWYLEHILPNKTEPFLFAPVCLCTAYPSLLEEFKGLFRRMSAPYGHWQVQDDVADFAKDTRHGIAGTPGYVIMKQADLSRRIRTDPSFRAGGAEMILRTAKEAGLLDSRFAGLNHDRGGMPALSDRDQAIRAALSNHPSVTDQSTDRLLRRAGEAGERYEQARSGGDPRSCRELLEATAVLHRLVPRIMPPRRAWHEEAAPPSMIRLLDYLETMVRRPTVRGLAMRERLAGGSAP